MASEPRRAAVGRARDDVEPIKDETGIVLIVEDDELVRGTYDIVLRHGGWTTLLADSAEAALECLRQDGGVSVMVTDLTMPGALDGQDLIELVKAGYPTIGIVLTTGKPVASGAFGDDVPVLLKPFRVEQLLDAALSVKRRDTSD